MDASRPFLGYSSKFVEVNRGFLDEEELSRLQNKELKIERIVLVRDVFLFSCYTGLSFIDAWNLTKTISESESTAINGFYSSSENKNSLSYTIIRLRKTLLRNMKNIRCVLFQENRC